MPKKFGVNYLKIVCPASSLFAQLATEKIISIYCNKDDDFMIVAAKNVNKSTLKKIAKSL